MGHRTPGSSQCQYWGELGCPTPLGDPTLQPGTPERGSAKLLLLSGRGRKGTGCWATLLLPPGNTGPLPHSCPTRLGPAAFPFFPSLPLPQEDTSSGHSTVQPPRPAEPSSTSRQPGQRNGCHCQHQSEGLQHVKLSPGEAEQAWGQAGLTLQEPRVAPAITIAEYQGADAALEALPLPGPALPLRAWGVRDHRDEDMRWSRDVHGQPGGTDPGLSPLEKRMMEAQREGLARGWSDAHRGLGQEWVPLVAAPGESSTDTVSSSDPLPGGSILRRWVGQGR